MEQQEELVKAAIQELRKDKNYAADMEKKEMKDTADMKKKEMQDTMDIKKEEKKDVAEEEREGTIRGSNSKYYNCYCCYCYYCFIITVYSNIIKNSLPWLDLIAEDIMEKPMYNNNSNSGIYYYNQK